MSIIINHHKIHHQDNHDRHEFKITMIIKLISTYSKASSLYLLFALTIILEGKREDGELVVKTPTSNSTEHDVGFQYRILKAGDFVVALKLSKSQEKIKKVAMTLKEKM